MLDRHIVLHHRFSPDHASRRTTITVVTISSRYQVVIPRDVRSNLKLQPGQKVQALPFKGRGELIPLEPIEAARGFVRGIDARVPRGRRRRDRGRASSAR